MQVLKKIGMEKGWIYEVIVSTYQDNNPHSAPVGVWTDNFDSLTMEIYKNSKMLENIMREREFAVNLASDEAIFYESLFDKAMVDYENATRINAPIIKNVPAVIELTMNEMTEKENRWRIESTPTHIQINDTIKLINRAQPLVVESLILATKLPHLPRLKIEDALKENYRVIRKVAPGSRYEEIVSKLIKRFGIS